MQQNNPEKYPEKQKKSYSAETIKVMSVAFELGFIVALPIVLLGLGGKWLDQKRGTGYFVYLGIGLAIILTSIWVYKRFADLVNKLEDAAQIKKNHNTETQPDHENNEIKK